MLELCERWHKDCEHFQKKVNLFKLDSYDISVFYSATLPENCLGNNCLCSSTHAYHVLVQEIIAICWFGLPLRLKPCFAQLLLFLHDGRSINIYKIVACGILECCNASIRHGNALSPMQNPCVRFPRNMHPYCHEIAYARWMLCSML